MVSPVNTHVGGRDISLITFLVGGLLAYHLQNLYDATDYSKALFNVTDSGLYCRIM